MSTKQRKALENRKQAAKNRLMSRLNSEIVGGVLSRKRSMGIGTAVGYVKTIIDCQNGLCPTYGAGKNTVASILKESASKLVYQNPDMKVIKSEQAGQAQGNFAPILITDFIATSINKDRDGDILHPEGAIIDPRMPLLWQHNPVQPLGKLLSVISQDKTDVRLKGGIADIPLGRDCAYLVQFGALRISHGFRPIKYRPVQGKDETGFEVFEYEMMEASYVSVPANPDAIIIGYETNKLESDPAKSLGRKYFENRKVIFKGGVGSKSTKDSSGESTDNNQGASMDETIKSIIAKAATVVHSGKAGHCFYREATPVAPENQSQTSPADGTGVDDSTEQGKSKKQSKDGVADSTDSQMTPDTTPGVDVVWTGAKEDFIDDAKDENGTPMSDAKAIKDIFASIPGVTSVQVSQEMQPQWNKGWVCAYPPELAGPWSDSDNTEANTVDQSGQNPDGAPTGDAPKSAAKVEKKQVCGCGNVKRVVEDPKPLPKLPSPKEQTRKDFISGLFSKYTLAQGSSEHIGATLEQQAEDYLEANGIDCDWYPVRVVSVYQNAVVVGVGVYDYWMSDSEQIRAKYYQIGFSLVDGVPTFNGVPQEVNIIVTYAPVTPVVPAAAATTPDSVPAGGVNPDSAGVAPVVPDIDGDGKSFKAKMHKLLNSHMIVKKIGKKAVGTLKEAQENLDEALKGDLKVPTKTLVMRGSQLVKEVIDGDNADDTSKDDNPLASDAQSEDSTATNASPKDVTGSEELDDGTKKAWGPDLVKSWEALRSTVKNYGANGESAIVLLCESIVGQIGEQKQRRETEEALKILSGL